MPFNQSGANAKADFTTYNDVAGGQTNNSKDIKTGNITGMSIKILCIFPYLTAHSPNAGSGGRGGNGEGRGFGLIAGGKGTGAAGGAGGTVNIS